MVKLGLMVALFDEHKMDQTNMLNLIIILLIVSTDYPETFYL